MSPFQCRNRESQMRKKKRKGVTNSESKRPQMEIMEGVFFMIKAYQLLKSANGPFKKCHGKLIFSSAK